MFDTGRIRTETSIANVEVHDELASTNDHALDLVRRKAVDPPALIVAHRQTAGRGRRENKWWSGAGSLTLSLVVTPKFTTGVSLLPLAAAIAIAESIESATSLRNIRIKWPNDLLANGKKLAGILIESIPTHPQPTYVVGIGINVNNDRSAEFGLEDSIDDGGLSPTSILIETNQEASLQSLLIEVVNQLTVEIESLDKKSELLIERVNRRLAYAGRRISIESANGKFTFGTCCGIIANGGLRVETPAGIIEVFDGSIRESG